MAVFKEIGTKQNMVIMQEVVYDNVPYLMEEDGTVHEKALDLPVVKKLDIIMGVRKQAAEEEGFNVR